MIYAILVLQLLSPLGLSYVDLRNQPCIMDCIRNIVTDNQNFLHSRLYLEMDCTGQYDYVLDTPKHYYCNIVNSTWEPDFIHDCNPLVRPDNVNIMKIFLLDTECDIISVASINSKTSIVLASGKTVEFSQLCRVISPQANCMVTDAASLCDKHKTESGLYKELDLDKVLTKFKALLYLKFTIKYSDVLSTMLTMLNDTDTNSLTVQQLDLPKNTTVLSKINVICPRGTLYQLDAERGMVCRGCSVGHFLSSESLRCVRCPQRQYGDKALSDSCKQCPPVPDNATASLDDGLVNELSCLVQRKLATPLAQMMFFSNVKETFQSLSESTIAVVIVCATLFFMIMAAILSLITQITTYRSTRAEGLRSRPPTPTEACFTESSSSTSLNIGSTRAEAFKLGRLTSIFALNHGINDGEGLPLNITQ